MIGIIGANGVAATNRLCALVEERVVKAGGFRDCHHPEMIIWQATQVPSRSMYLEGRGESFIPEYIEIGRRLKDCGCDEICMCCNTAHYYIKELEQGVGLPFINLIEEVGLRIKSLGAKKVGLMCSDGLAKVKFYDKVFSHICPEAIIYYPSEEYQRIVTRGICNAKNTERYTPVDNAQNPAYCFAEVTAHLVSQGVECVVAGCTDINNVFSPSSVKGLNGIEYVDSLEVLADCISQRNSNLPK